jgi:hypothetical protein
MKIINSLGFQFFIVFLIVSCQQKEKLLGKWERYGDPLSGMIIEISNIGGSFKAEIISAPDSVQQKGFFIGDIKWRDIKKIDKNKYEYVDLKKTGIPYSEPIRFKSENGLARLELIDDSIIKTRLFAKGDEDYGTETSWKRK